MASLKSNLPDVARCVNSLSEALNLNRKTRGGGTFGGVMFNQIAIDIYNRSIHNQTDPEGRRWKKLKLSTIRRKQRQGRPTIISVDSAEMMQLPFLEGKQVFGATVATMEYHGTKAADEKAEHFQEAGREFYGIGRESISKLDNLGDIQIDNVIQELGG